MKKLIGIVCLAVCSAFVGCKSVPSTDKMFTISYATGAAAGLIANETEIDAASRNTIVDIVNKVSQCTPETNQTFEVAWTPIAQAHTDKLIADGKITAEQGKLVMAAFNLVVKGIDYLFEVRYPKARQYKDVVESAIDGATSGFLAVFKSVNSDTKTLSKSSFDYDVDAYNWLNANK